MKIIFFLFILLSALQGNDEEKASSIFNLLVKNIVKKENANVYISSDIESLKHYPGNLHIVNSCKDADIIIFSNIKDIPLQCKDSILFGTRYAHLKNENVIGAFFWQKGRPNILFYKKRLQKYNVELNASFDRYIENR